jgi:hypothetical protein
MMFVQKTYHAGREARDQGFQKSPPGYLDWELRHWWLAGWNDRDMELLPQ